MNRKPRNPLVAAAKFRRAGHHGKTSKALRREDKTALLRLIKNTRQNGNEVSLSVVLVSAH
jgi:hypothetical protein